MCSLHAKRGPLLGRQMDCAAVPVREMAWQVPSQLARLMIKVLDLQGASAQEKKQS